MRHILSYLSLAILLLLLAGCQTDLVTGDDVSGADDDVFTNDSNLAVTNTQALEALSLVNNVRASGCTCGDEVMPPVAVLQLHPALQRAAEVHTADQALNQNMSHVGSDGSRVGDRLTAAGYSWSNVGENVAWNQRSVVQVVDAWIGSPGHCRNIMNPAYRYMGFAENDWYWTQVFAR